VLVPDLYKGKVGVDAEEASHVRGCVDGWVGGWGSVLYLLLLFVCMAEFK